MNRNPYPAYRPSGVEWLGEVPEGWEVKKLKYTSSIRYGIGEPPEYVDEGTPLIRATNVDAGRIVSKDLKFVDPRDIPTARIVWLRSGDIVVVRSGAYTGDSAIVPDQYAGAIAGFDMVLSARSLEPHFLAQVLLSDYFRDGQVYLLKLRAAQPHLNAEELGDCLVVTPPFPEQRAIAAFLDRETARLGTLLAKKRRLVELLKERRSAVITRAVTRGLDPTVQLKDSGVEWIGEVPEGWTTNRVGRMVMARKIEIQDGNHGELHPTADDYTSDGIPFLMANDINNGKVDLINCTFIDPETARDLRIGFAKIGDVLLTHKGTIGRVGILGPTTGPYAMLTPQVTYYRCIKTLLPAFLRFGMESKYWQEQLGFLGSVGSTRAYVGIREQRNLFLTYPRSIPEQQSIVAYLDRETAQIDALVAKVETAIEKLTEYRTALISAAVTGKIDVRDEA